MFRSALVCLSLFACNGDKDEDSNSGGDDSGTDDTGTSKTCEPTKVTCQDEMVENLSLHDEVTDGEVATATDGDDFVTTIDASAGGFTNAANNPWVYVKFETDGAVRVDITDEQAFVSQDWDLAAHRFVLRLNGGSSGPSCVGAAVVPSSTYEELDAVPAGVTYRTDDFYTDDCTMIEDSFGLGSPQVVLGPWWEYPGCVATTGTPFLVQVADGRVLKLVVEEYYSHGEQEICNTTGAMGEHSGYYAIRWAWLPPA